MTVESGKYNPRPIKVLCVNLEGSISGSEQSLLLLVRFAPASIQISAACPTGVLMGKLSDSGVSTYRISTPPRKFNLSIIWLFYLTIVNLQLSLIVHKAKPQIIHANSTKAVLATILPRVFICHKLICHFRDLRYLKLLARICSCFFTKVIAVSKTVKDNLINLGIKAEFIKVIYNGIDIDELPAESRERCQNRDITFANIGQFVPWKKQFLFIQAAERFLQDGQNGQFILIGDDIFGRDSRYKKELINRVRTSLFAQNIKIIDWQDRLDSFWPRIDCLVHTTDAEPFGNVIIEAMARGIPVIASAANGPRETIISGKTGLLFKPNDIEELLKAMKIISRDRELAHNLAINARQYIVSHFQARNTAEKISRVYEELAAA